MAKTKIYKDVEWDTVHNNSMYDGPFDTSVLYETELAEPQEISDPVERYNDGCREIRRLLKSALGASQRFRAYGSSWSLSDIAYQKDRMHYNAAMNLHLDVQAYVHAQSPFLPENLFFYQCGNTIKEISRDLKNHGKSLKTSGASNGQTIAGAVSTGVHGAALDVGSVQDCIVGIHLIIGPETNDMVYVERASRPALSNSFAGKIHSKVIRDDGLFNAALVGLGSFGFVAGYTLEAEDIYLLRRYTRKINASEAIKLCQTLDFKHSSFQIDQERQVDGTMNRPYHFKVYINPYNPEEDNVVEVMYKKSYRSDYPDPRPVVEKFIYTDMPGWISKFAAKNKRIIPKMIRAMKKEIFPDLDQDSIGTLGEIFWDTQHRGPGFAWAFGVDHKDTQQALDLFLEVIHDDGPVPGAIAIRLVKQTKATLGFTRFPVTSVIEMDGISWKGNRRLPEMKVFERKFIEKFKAHELPFTIHWGKNAAWDFPGLTDYMYGEKDDEWKNYRSALLSRSTADLFSNDFLIRCGLADYRNQTPDLLT